MGNRGKGDAKHKESSNGKDKNSQNAKQKDANRNHVKVKISEREISKVSIEVGQVKSKSSDWITRAISIAALIVSFCSLNYTKQQMNISRSEYEAKRQEGICFNEKCDICLNNETIKTAYMIPEVLVLITYETTPIAQITIPGYSQNLTKEGTFKYTNELNDSFLILEKEISNKISEFFKLKGRTFHQNELYFSNKEYFWVSYKDSDSEEEQETLYQLTEAGFITTYSKEHPSYEDLGDVSMQYTDVWETIYESVNNLIEKRLFANEN